MLLHTSSILFSEYLIMISTGILLIIVALKINKISTLNLNIKNITSYTLILTLALLYQTIDITYINNIFIINPLITTIKFVVILCALIFTFLIRRGITKISEINILLLIGVVGIFIILSSNDLLMLYLGLELQSLTMYILATLNRNGEFSTEAGFKYFILGAVSSGIYLLGCAYIYYLYGDTSFTLLSDLNLSNISYEIGFILIMISLLWKLGAAPLHMWIPDVYEGSPNIITTLFAIIPKIGIVTAIINLLTGPMHGILSIQYLFLLTSILSLLVGSIGALNQSKFKRVLAYSAISHTGFILAGLSTFTIEGIITTIIYNIIYIVMAWNTFTIVANYLPTSINYNNIFVGLSKSNKFLSFTFAISLLSLAGIPPLAGFLSKYLILISIFNEKLYILTGFAVLSSVISAYFYISIIKIMYFKDTNTYNWKVLADYSTNYFLSINKSMAIIISASLYFILTSLLFPLPIFSLFSDVILSSLI